MVIAIPGWQRAGFVAPAVHHHHVGLGDVRADREVRQGSVLRHVERRGAVRGIHGHAVEDRNSRARHCQAIDVERDPADGLARRIQQVSARHVEAEHAPGDEHLPLTGADRKHLDGRSLEWRAVGREHDVLAVGQDLRPPVPQLACRGVRRGEHPVIAPAFADDPQPGVVGARVDDPAVPAPTPARPVGHREVDRRSALHADLPQLSLFCVGDPLSVRRDERPAVSGSLIALTGARDHLHPQLIEPTTQHLLPPVDHRGDEQLPAVRAQAHDRRKAGLHSRLELDAEAHRAR